jgi:hypothetical protein
MPIATTQVKCHVLYSPIALKWEEEVKAGCLGRLNELYAPKLQEAQVCPVHDSK